MSELWITIDTDAILHDMIDCELFPCSTYPG